MDVSPSNNRYLSAFSKNWGWFLIWGIALIILGVIAVKASVFTTVLSVIFLGTLLLIGGAVIIIDAFSFWWHQWTGFFLNLIMGILYCAIGVMFIESPLIAAESITLFLGLFYLIIGVVRLVYTLMLRTPRWGWGFFNALISLLLGILILTSWPASGLFILGLFIGIDLICSGVVYTLAAFAARGAK